MKSLLPALSHHGYLIIMAVVFLEAIGLPAPAALALLIGGAVSATGALNTWAALGCAIGAMMTADLLMFFVGRHTGWWLLGILCRLSLNPESCILRSADSFYRRGRALLLFAKFVPGINTMAPPLSGSMNMRLTQFILLDLTGAALYIGSWFALGFIFSDALEAITRSYNMVGQAMGWVLTAGIVIYAGLQAWLWTRARAGVPVPVMKPDQAADAYDSGFAVIYDVRSHGYYDVKADRIRGSRRLEPNALTNVEEEFSGEKLVLVYCT